MSDEELMKTSEITARLRHSSPAVTRAWIRDRGIEAVNRDVNTGEKLYSRSTVEQAIAEMPRGPYRRGERSQAEDGRPRHDHDGVPGDSGV